MTTTAKMPVYNLDDYTRIQIDNNNGYLLPDQVIDSIRTLCAEIGYDINTTKDTYINQHNQRQWVRSVLRLGDKWLTFKPMGRLNENQSSH